MYLPLVLHDLNEDFTLKAEKELKENEVNKNTALQKIKKLIQYDNLACCTEDDTLIMFLRNKKYDVNRSFQQLKIYCAARSVQMKLYFMPNTSETTRRVLDSKICGVLPRRDHEGRAIVFFRTSQYCSNAYTSDDVMRTLQALCHFVLSFPATQISGICFIADVTVDSVEVFQFLFKYLKISVPKIRVFPARFIRIDCINMNLMFRTCFHLIRPLMPSKILQRTTLHGDEKDALLKIYPASILPEEFGGTLGSLDNLQKTWIDEFLAFLPKHTACNAFYEKKKVAHGTKI